MGKNIVGFLLSCIVFVCGLPIQAHAAEEVNSIGIEAPHAVLMEASTGTILYEKDAHVAVPPASVTKIMTMLLIFEALENHKIKLEDTIYLTVLHLSMRNVC